MYYRCVITIISNNECWLTDRSSIYNCNKITTYAILHSNGYLVLNDYKANQSAKNVSDRSCTGYYRINIGKT